MSEPIVVIGAKELLGIGSGGVSLGFLGRILLEKYLPKDSKNKDGVPKEDKNILTKDDCEKAQQYCPLNKEFAIHKTSVNGTLKEHSNFLNNIKETVDGMSTLLNDLDKNVGILIEKTK